jgi:hypothetical protein
MASMNIREVDVTSLERFKARAALEGMTLRAWVLAVLAVALMDDGEVVEASAEARESRSAPARQRAQAEPAIPPQKENPTAARVDLPMIGRRPVHNPKTCRVYRCGACLKAQHHDSKRGL